jgi:hypothetical protein
MGSSLTGHVGAVSCGRFWCVILFAGLAVLAVGFAFASPFVPDVLYAPTSTLILSVYPSPRHVQFFIAIASAISALIYFAVAHWSLHRFSRSLTLLHLVLFAVAVYLIAVSLLGFADRKLLGDMLYNASIKGPDTRFTLSRWPILASTVGIWAVELGCLAFLANLGIISVKVFRKRGKSSAVRAS